LNLSADVPVNVCTKLLLLKWSLISYYSESIAPEATQPIIASCDYYSPPLGNGGTAPPPLPSFYIPAALRKNFSWFPVNQCACDAFLITKKLLTKRRWTVMYIFKKDIVAGILVALLLAIASSMVQAGKAGGGQGGGAGQYSGQGSQAQSTEQNRNQYQYQHQKGSGSGKGQQSGDGSKQQTQDQDREQTQTRTEEAE
jgi:hypothetical protein